MKGAAKYYVYTLSDPETNAVFYVGKGCGGRVKSHVKEVMAGRTPTNLPKHARIVAILNKGLFPVETIIESGMCEQDALGLEAKMIGEIDGLTNIAGGCVNPFQKVVMDAISVGNMLPSYKQAMAINKDQAVAIESVFGSMSGYVDFMHDAIVSAVDIAMSGSSGDDRKSLALRLIKTASDDSRATDWRLATTGC